jgi:hypothetical protein
MNFGNYVFSGFDEVETYIVQIKLGNQIVQNVKYEMFPEMMKTQFFNLVQQIAKDQRPMSARCMKKVYVGKDENMPQDVYVMFGNNAYVNSFPQEFEEKVDNEV